MNMLRQRLEQAALPNHLCKIGERGQALGVDQVLQLQPEEFLERVSVHSCSRGVGGQNAAGLQIGDQHTVTGGFKHGAIQVFGFRCRSIHRQVKVDSTAKGNCAIPLQPECLAAAPLSPCRETRLTQPTTFCGVW